ncbi:YicC/YloC family endoribonuclease [Pararhodospirillum oryzae]|uniref:YicC family protein n=1 Tax=Pararhodospirillum oryzae TaxID=478448 RepID=A0A512HB21_9PROT|nr:YicC/YloC family endoribonuclease [Pararhodospirillum oryzae]GEO82639.1 hypothetical protein ROR02_27700 [Pararhodospirillum oryzae]
MSLLSMTGFARAQGRFDRWAWTWEIRAVNGKGLDVRLRLPPGTDSLDQPARRLIGERATRGSVSATLNVETDGQAPAWRLNEPLLRQLLDLAASLDAPGVEPPRLDGLLALRGVLEPVAEAEEDPARRAAREAAHLTTLAEALDAFTAARAEEGTRLAHALRAHLDQIETLIRAARETEALRPESQRERLRRQVSDLLDALSERAGPDRAFDDRLAQELALLAIKTDVREELDRLDAHLASARALLDKGGPVGRRLEFLSQEFNREANTLCSKAQDPALTRIGLDLKVVIDQFREQILNIE